MDIYSIQMPKEVSKELRERADRLEKEIGRGRDEEQILSMVDEDCKRRKEEHKKSSPSAEEKLFGTAIADGQEADYK